MKVLIDIPTKNFGVDITNKFQDFFQRLQVETKAHLISNTNDLCGSYELETIEMFLNAFEKMQIIPDNATNYDVLKAVFGNTSAFRIKDTMEFEKGFELWFSKPYKRGNEE